MKLLYWLKEDIAVRIALSRCYINILGETHIIQRVDGPAHLGNIIVHYGKDEFVSLYLDDMTALENGSLFYFRTSIPDEVPGVLVIPPIGIPDEEDENE